MPITRAQMQKQLLPGLKAVYGNAYAQYPEQWSKYFDSETSDRSFEQVLKIAGFGLATARGEGAGITYSTAGESYSSQYTHTVYSIAFSLTEEAIEDNLYAKVGAQYTKACARSMSQTKEIVHANVINNGFSAGFLGGDGVTLFSTAHPLRNGGVNSNRPTTGADLNETSLNNARIQIGNWTDDAGLKINAKPQQLLHPIDLSWTVERLLKTVLATGTANNDINAIQSTNMFPKGSMVCNYFTDTNAWVIKTDVQNGLTHFTRRADKLEQEGDFNTGNLLFKLSSRWSAGWSDPLAVFSSPGA